MRKFFNLDRFGVPSLIILVLMISIGPFGDTEYSPSMPRIARELMVHYDLVQLTMTSYLSGYAISQLFYGPISDRFGRKPIMLIGASMFVMGSLLCMLSNNIGQLIGGRFIQAVGACAGGVISSSSVRDAYPAGKREHVFAKMNAAYAIAPALGPIVGTLLDEYFGWHTNFFLLLILSIILFISVWLFFPETNRDRMQNATHPKHFLLNYLHILRDPYFLAYQITMGMCIGIVYCSLVVAPILVINILKLHSIGIVIISLSVMAGFILGSLLCHLLLWIIPSRYVLLLGLIIMLSASILYECSAYFGWASTLLLANLVPIALIFTGIACVMPIGTAQSLAPFGRTAGSASAMVGFFQMGLAALSTGMMSLFFTDGSIYTLPHMYVMLSGLGLGTYMVLILSRPNRRPK